VDRAYHPHHRSVGVTKNKSQRRSENIREKSRKRFTPEVPLVGQYHDHAGQSGGLMAGQFAKSGIYYCLPVRRPGGSMRGLLIAIAAVAVSVPAVQNTGRFAALTAKGIEAVEKGRFNDGINFLEEVWEQDRTDPAVAENLGLSYLYADRDTARAREYMEAAIALGGRASFLVQHAHEKATLVSMDTNDYCSGRLSIYRDRLAFTSTTNPAHSFVVQAGDFKEIKRNAWFGNSEGVWHIKTRGKTYNLRPRTWSERETKLVLFFIDKYVGGKH
jgi:hypothetical protein